MNRVELLGHGGEAVVFLVEPVGDWCAGEAEVVVKVDMRFPADLNQLRLLSLPRFTRHVPRIFDYGDAVMRGVTVGWVAQEYCRLGSLSDAIYGDAPPRGDGELRGVIAELAECLRFWLSEHGLTHTDVKPANILVRSRDPYRLLVGDFGGTARDVRSEEGVRNREPLAFTLSYASPETLRNRRGAPAAWWALGVIAYELLLHRTPYAGMTSDEVQRLLLAGRRPEPVGIADPEWRRLIEGLLVVAPERRWGYDQVAAWVAGEASAGAGRPLRFNGRTYREIEHLVDDLEQNWRPGARWLAENGARVADLLVRRGAAADDVRYLRSLTPGRAPRALGRLTARVLPEVTPRYEGQPIDAAGLLKLAQRGETEKQLLRRALEDGALEYAAAHHCAHPGCRSRCAVLDRVRVEVPEVMGRVGVKLGWVHDRVVQSYRGRAPAELPSGREWTMLWAWATEMTLRPEAAGRARALAAAVPADVSWWVARRRVAENADPGTAEGRADLVVALLLAVHARRATR